MEATQSAPKTKVRDLRDGDSIDLLELGADYPLDEVTRDAAQYQNTYVVADGDDETPWTVESSACWVLHTEAGSFGVDPDWEFQVLGRAKR